MNWSRWNRGRLMEAEGGEGGAGGGAAAAAPAAGESLLGGGVVTPAAGAVAPPNWIPESWNGVASLAPFTSFDGEMVSVPKEMLAKLGDSYSNTKKLVGAKLERPGSDATAEQQAYWRKVNNAPDEAKGYNEGKSFRPESIPEEAWRGNVESEMLAIAHKHANTPEAVKDYMDFYARTIQAEMEAATTKTQQMLTDGQARLHQEWGAEYDTNVAHLSQLATAHGLKLDNPHFQDAELVLFLTKIAAPNRETPIRNSDFSGGGGSSVSDRIKDIQDPKGTSMLSREYRREFGEERQLQAQAQLHALQKSLKK